MKVTFVACALYRTVGNRSADTAILEYADRQRFGRDRLCNKAGAPYVNRPDQYGDAVLHRRSLSTMDKTMLPPTVL